jgi:Protein of unknown function (DUF2934)
MTRTREVEAEYRDAFEDFSRKAHHVQVLTAQGSTDGKAFEIALLELEKAHLAYNQARDAFLQSLLPESAQILPADDHDRTGDVPVIAELIWESAGRPEGTAQEDWRRAEAIVKSAVTTAACD